MEKETNIEEKKLVFISYAGVQIFNPIQYGIGFGSKNKSSSDVRSTSSISKGFDFNMYFPLLFTQ